MNWIYIVLVLIILYLLRKLSAVRIIWFYSEKCPHCENMKEEWEKFESMARLSLFPPIETSKVDVSFSANMRSPNDIIKMSAADRARMHYIASFNIQGIPHIAKIDANGMQTSFSRGAERKADILMKWAKTDFDTWEMELRAKQEQLAKERAAEYAKNPPPPASVSLGHPA